MASLDSLLTPEALKNIQSLRNQLPTQEAQSATQDSQGLYDSLFGNNGAIADQLTPELANKSAAESAATLAQVPVDNSASAAAEAAGSSGADLLGAAGDVAGPVLAGIAKLAGPASVLYEGLKSTPTGNVDDTPKPIPGQPGRYTLGDEIVTDEDLAKRAGTPMQPISLNPLAGLFDNLRTPDDSSGDDSGDGTIKSKLLATLGVAPGASGGGNAADRTPSAQSNVDEDDDDDEADTVAKSKPNTPLNKSPNPAQAQTQQKDYLQTLIDQMKSQMANGGNDLAAAQQARQQIQQLAGMGIAGQQLGAALSRGAIKPDYTAQQQMLNQGNQAVSDVQERQKAAMDKMEAGIKLSDLQDKSEQRDPNSKISQSIRSIAQKLGLPVDPNSSYEEIVKTQPLLDTYMKRETMKNNKEFQNKVLADNKMNQNEQKYTNQREQMYSMRGPGGRAAQVMQAAQKLQALSSMYKDQNDIPPPLLQSAAADFATIMQNGGVPHADELHQLVPPTLSSKISTLGSALTSNPTGAGMGKYMDMLNNTAKELQNTSQKYLQDHEQFLLNGYKNSLRPDFYQTQKSRVDSLTAPPVQAPQKDYSSQIKAFRQAHPESKLSDDDISNALQKMGG